MGLYVEHTQVKKTGITLSKTGFLIKWRLKNFISAKNNICSVAVRHFFSMFISYTFSLHSLHPPLSLFCYSLFPSLPATYFNNSLLLSPYYLHFLPFTGTSFHNSLSRFILKPHFFLSSSIISYSLSLITSAACSLTARPLPLVLSSPSCCFLASILYLFHSVFILPVGIAQESLLSGGTR